MKYGRYQVIKEIGKGSMGMVYMAHDPNLDLSVALKVLRHDRVESAPFVRRFLAEARVLGRLDNSNIVRVYNVDEDSGTVYIAMEFVEGDSLSEIMQKKRFSPEEIVEVGITIANALDYAHQKRIVHRDIKPGNILIRSDGFLKITDFGIAHIQDSQVSEKTQAGEILGTPAYMSPEQVMCRPVDGRSDLFSLGVILYELCTGARPFRGDNMPAIFNAITQGNPDNITKINPSIPNELSQVIMKCLNKKPDKRFQTGNALAEALKSLLKESETVRLIAPVSQKKPNKIILITLSVILFISVIMGLSYYVFIVSKAESPPAVRGVSSAFLKVDSMPVGARVFIDGSFKGNTPVKLNLLTGKHEVRLTLTDYYDWEARVQLKDGGETPLLVRLIPID